MHPISALADGIVSEKYGEVAFLEAESEVSIFRWPVRQLREAEPGAAHVNSRRTPSLAEIRHLEFSPPTMNPRNHPKSMRFCAMAVAVITRSGNRGNSEQNNQ